MQHLLAGAVWDHDAVRDDVRDYLVDHLGDPAAVLVVDETGNCKKGTTTVDHPVPGRGGVRQVDGDLGVVDLAGGAGVLALHPDRELYVPQGWLADAERCHAAGVPAQRAFATKPELARVMLQRALDAGVPASWVTADEVYGGSPALRGWLETRAMPFVLAVKRSEPLPRRTGRPRQRPGWPSTSRRRAGCASAPARAPRAAAGTRGAAWRWPPPARRRGGSAGCWSAAA
jgi:SRSO17 transposase